MSDTPKTDELAKRDFVPDGLWIRHARELERENAALCRKAELEKARLKFLEKYVPELEKCCSVAATREAIRKATT